MNVTIWNEGLHEHQKKATMELYPQGLHGVLAEVLGEVPGVEKIRIATLEMPDCGLPPEVLEDTDVLFWWGHIAHDKVPDALVERIYDRVMRGMGLVVLHSAHLSKIFQKLLGTTCSLRWREETYGRVHCVMPGHPIAQNIPEHFELGTEETYGEPFDVPTPDELVFISWFDSGEVFRSGCTWYRGRGKIFYFQPGHETNRSFYNPVVRQIWQNACQWAAPTNPIPESRDIWECKHLVTTLEDERKASEQ